MRVSEFGIRVQYLVCCRAAAVAAAGVWLLARAMFSGLHHTYNTQHVSVLAKAPTAFRPQCYCAGNFFKTRI